MAQTKRAKRGYTLAELMVTLAVMGVVLALVAAFSAAASGASRERSDTAAALAEIEKVNELITDWYYTFDDTEYKFLKVETKPEEYKYDYINGTVVSVSPSEFTIQNKKFNEMIDDGIVPTNYQLVYNVDKDSLHKVITAVYSAKGNQNKSITLNYIKSIQFDYEENLGLLKCTYKYNLSDEKEYNGESILTYSLVLSKHT